MDKNKLAVRMKDMSPKPVGLQLLDVPDGIIFKWDHVQGKGVHAILDYNVQVLNVKDMLWSRSRSYCTKNNYVKLNLACNTEYEIRVRGRSSMGLGHSSDILVVQRKKSNVCQQQDHIPKIQPADRKNILSEAPDCHSRRETERLRNNSKNETMRDHFPWSRSLKLFLEKEKKAKDQRQAKVANNYDINYATEKLMEQTSVKNVLKSKKVPSVKEVKNTYSHPGWIERLKGHSGEISVSEFSSHEKQLASCAEDHFPWSRSLKLFLEKEKKAKDQRQAKVANNYDINYATEKLMEQTSVKNVPKSKKVPSVKEVKNTYSHPGWIERLKGHSGEISVSEFSSHEKQLASCAEGYISRIESMAAKASDTIEMLNLEINTKTEMNGHFKQAIIKLKEKQRALINNEDDLKKAISLVNAIKKLIFDLKEKLKGVSDENANLRAEVEELVNDVQKRLDDHEFKIKMFMDGPVNELENILERWDF